MFLLVKSECDGRSKRARGPSPRRRFCSESNEKNKDKCRTVFFYEDSRWSHMLGWTHTRTLSITIFFTRKLKKLPKHCSYSVWLRIQRWIQQKKYKFNSEHTTVI